MCRHVLLASRRSAIETFTGVPGEIPRAAPSSTVSPAVTPDRISTVSVVASRMPSTTSAFSTLPSFTRMTVGRTPRSSTAPRGTTAEVRDLARHAPLGEQARDERSALIRDRRDHAHLTRRRVGDGIDARDAPDEPARAVAVDA